MICKINICKNVSCLPKYWVPYIQWFARYNIYLYHARSVIFQMKCHDRSTKTIYSRTDAMVPEPRYTRVRKMRLIRLHNIIIICVRGGQNRHEIKSTLPTMTDHGRCCVYARGCEWAQQSDAYNIKLYIILI